MRLEGVVAPNRSELVVAPNCYQPVIGTPGVIDTIYGSYKNQQLGGYVKNLWPDKDNSYGNIIITSDSNFFNPPFLTYKSGADFNLHKLISSGTFNLGAYRDSFNVVPVDPRNLIKRGHFHSKKYDDLLFDMQGRWPRIYWADDNGKYDSSFIV